MDTESAKKYVESVCEMIAAEHNVDINMTGESMIDNPEWRQLEINFTLVVNASKHKPHTKRIYFHEKQLLHSKSEQETLRVSHHMLNFCERNSA